jgi:hypothetical protein
LTNISLRHDFTDLFLISLAILSVGYQMYSNTRKDLRKPILDFLPVRKSPGLFVFPYETPLRLVLYKTDETGPESIRPSY